MEETPIVKGKASTMYDSKNGNKSQEQHPKKDFVLRMVNAGYNVIPISGKHPPCIPWKEFQSRQVRPEEIVSWGRDGFVSKDGKPWKPELLNFGLLTGVKPYSEAPALIVIDTDGEEAEKLVFERCPITPVMQRTGRGGFHRIYRRPPLSEYDYISNRQGTTISGVRYGIDIRGDGGYILCPGSTHPITKRLYEELKPWTTELIAAAAVYSPLWFPDEGQQERPKAKQADREPYQPTLELTARQELAQEFLRCRPGSTAKRASDNYCFALAMSLIHGFSLTPDEALPIFLEWGEKESNRDELGGYYPWKESELMHKLEDAANRDDDRGEGFLLPVDDTPIDGIVKPLEREQAESDFVKEAVKVATAKADKKATEERLNLIGWEYVERKAKENPPIALIDRLIHIGDIHFITALPWGGKSTILGEAIATVCQGTDFFGYRTRESKVLFINSDLTPYDLVFERINQGVTNTVKLVKNFFAHKFDTLPSAMDTDYILKFIDNQIPDVDWIIIDTLRTAFLSQAEKGTENDAAIAKYIQPFRTLGKSKNKVVSFLHHNNRTHDTMAGSAVLQGLADSIWNCSREKNSNRVEVETQTRRGYTEKFIVVRDENGKLHKGDGRTEQFISFFGSFPGRTLPDVLEVNKPWFDLLGITDKTVRNWLTEAQKHGLCRHPEDTAANKPARYFKG